MHLCYDQIQNNMKLLKTYLVLPMEITFLGTTKNGSTDLRHSFKRFY